MLGSLGCRLVIIVSVPREQEPLGCRLILLSWEQGHKVFHVNEVFCFFQALHEPRPPGAI